MGSAGVALDSSAKSGIFRAETTLEATDSDLRLDYSVRNLLIATNEIASGYGYRVDLDTTIKALPRYRHDMLRSINRLVNRVGGKPSALLDKLAG